MRSSGEIRAEIDEKQAELREVEKDISNMKWDRIKMVDLEQQATTLVEGVEGYDVSQEGEWEGDLYNEGITQYGFSKAAANNVKGDITTLKEKLDAAYDVACERRRTLIDRLEELSRELERAIAEEEAAAAQASENGN